MRPPIPLPRAGAVLPDAIIWRAAGLTEASPSAAKTSRSIIRPPGPVPLIPSRGTPRSLAVFLARGETAPETAGVWALGASGAAAFCAGALFSCSFASSTAGAEFFDAAPEGARDATSSPASPTAAITVNTGTSAPSGKNCFSRIPSAGDSISKVALSVSTSQTISPPETWSPSFFRHSRITQDSTLFPCLGINISVAISLSLVLVYTRSISSPASASIAATSSDIPVSVIILL